MANSRPYTDAHAIACVDAAVFYQSDLSEEQVAGVRDAMQELLIKDGFEVHPVTSKSTVSWRKTDDEGDPTEEFHIHPGFFHFSAFEYRGWTYTREVILNRLDPAIRHLADKQVRLLGVGLAFIDVFFNDTPDEYDIKDIFAPRSRYLPEVIYESGLVWKSQHSWLEEFSGADVQNSLTISARFLTEANGDELGDGRETEEVPDEIAPDQHLTEIQNKLSVMDGLEIQADWDRAEIGAKLDLLHARNKVLLLNLLSEDMIRRIGLKE